MRLPRGDLIGAGRAVVRDDEISDKFFRRIGVDIAKEPMKILDLAQKMWFVGITGRVTENVIV